MPPKSKTGAKKLRRKEKKNVAHGHAHIKSTFNNTIVSITDPSGAVISWASAGQVGFKGSRKSTPFAAQMTAEAAARRAQEHGMRKVDVFVKGPGSGRETAIRALQAAGLEVGSIQDVTPAFRSTAAARPSAVASDASRLKQAGESWPGIPVRTAASVVAPRPSCTSRAPSATSAKCPFEVRPYPPGQHGRGRSKDSEYLLQLREKQKAKQIYGIFERQFRGYYEEASQQEGQDRRQPAAHPRDAASTTSSTAPASASHATWPASSCGTATSR